LPFSPLTSREGGPIRGVGPGTTKCVNTALNTTTTILYQFTQPPSKCTFSACFPHCTQVSLIYNSRASIMESAKHNTHHVTPMASLISYL